jgi:quercetin dioxygenase-like cupin family protein
MVAEGVEPSLHVTDDIALVQARGGEVIVMRPGDTVHTPPGEWHWHGAAPDTFMAHLAMSDGTGNLKVRDVQWGEHVSDEEYRKAAAIQ